MMQSIDATTLPMGRARVARDDIARSLGSLIPQLNQISESAGAGFLSLGGRLQGLFRRAETLFQVTGGEHLPPSIQNEGNAFNEIAETATISLEALRQSQDQSEELLDRISETVAVIKRLLRSAESIFDMGGQLEIIGINLAIQTSRHRHGTETFEDFSSEIKGFAAYTRRFAEDIQKDAQEVAQLLVSVKNQLDQKLRHMAGFIDQAQRSTASTLSEIRQLAMRTAEVMALKAEHARNISSSVNEAIVAIQIDDMTRQRLGHVVEALASVLRSETPLGDAVIILKLQGSQVHEVRADIERAVRDIQAVFGTIGKETDAIVRLSGDGRSGEVDTIQHSLENLRGTLVALSRIHKEAGEVRRSISESLDGAILASGRISRHIGDVSTITQELNLKAINALLMSRDLGSEGNNLVVLATELHSLSKESIGFVDALKVSIEHVADVTTSLKQSTLEHRGVQMDSDAFEEKLSLIDIIMDALETSASDSHRLNGDITAALDEIIEDLEAVTSSAHKLRRCENELVAIARTSDADLETDSATRKAALDAVYHHYTMEGERRVHRSLNGSSEVPAPEPAAAAQDDEELGNFELF